MISVGLCAALPYPLQADREHRVVAGQTLSGVAARYGISVSSLAAANRLGRDAGLREGQLLLVPEPGVIYVGAGETLSQLALRHQVTVAELVQHNGLRSEGELREGQRLLLPGYAPARKKSLEPRRAKHPGKVTLLRLANNKRLDIRLLDRSGRVQPQVLRALGRFMRARDMRRGKEPHPRLVRLLAQVSDHFEGRPIHVVSGTRRAGGFTKTTSRHVAGQAIDFRIPGIPLESLHAYCQSLRHTGVGLYPRSNFVHLDVRRTNARWTDWSGPGEAPVKQRPQDPGASDPEPTDDEPAAEDDGLDPIDAVTAPSSRARLP